MSLRSYVACHLIAGGLVIGAMGGAALLVDALHNGRAHAICLAAALADRRPVASCDIPNPPVSLFPSIR